MRFVNLPDNDVYSGPPSKRLRPPLEENVSAGLTLQFTMSFAATRLEARCGNLFSAIALMVEPDGIEPTTSCLQSTRSTN
jgi:hypothetical protein